MANRANEVGRWIATFHEFPTDMIETLMLLDETDYWEELGPNPEEGMPIFDSMWSFSGSLDQEWGESKEGQAALLQCGFRVYRSERFGIFFGVNSTGYDFVNTFWESLYRLRFRSTRIMGSFP